MENNGIYWFYVVVNRAAWAAIGVFAYGVLLPNLDMTAITIGWAAGFPLAIGNYILHKIVFKKTKSNNK